ncbi:hypothetical protein QE152_g6479 [Popillia japonica]|uniref:Uncharacterized protein n=1 Tax=Popillia japonica TaxID=7064 RepID=A0AAW1MI62_POPJA
MHPSHTPFQRILWRENKEEAIKTYELITVTYGTVPASFLAVRAFQQLGRDESQNFPIGHEIILRDFYVDDLLTGAILRKGGFELRKWNSNTKNLLKRFDRSDANTKNLLKRFDRSDDMSVLNLDKDEEANTLGLQWNAKLDVLQYSVHQIKHPTRITKRYILSSIAKIFDPLGLQDNEFKSFIDNEGLLRVGGRLKDADIPCQQKHPIIIPKIHPLTKLIIMREHLRFRHAGIQAT